MGYLLAALLGGFFVFNSQATPQKAEELAERALHQQFPTAQVDVEIRGKRGRDIMKGRFRSIKATISHFSLADLPFSAGNGKNLGHAGQVELQLRDFSWGNLPVQSADFSFQNVEYDLDALKQNAGLKIVHSGPAAAHLTLAAQALESKFSLPEVEDGQLTLENGVWKFSGRKIVLGVGVPFIFTARPTGEGNQVFLRDAKVSAGGVPLLALATGPLLKGVNPIYTFDPQNKWPFNVRLSEVKAENGVLEMTADLTLKSDS